METTLLAEFLVVGAGPIRAYSLVLYIYFFSHFVVCKRIGLHHSTRRAHTYTLSLEAGVRTYQPLDLLYYTATLYIQPLSSFTEKFPHSGHGINRLHY